MFLVFRPGEILPEDAETADGLQKQGASILKLLGCGPFASPLLTFRPVALGMEFPLPSSSLPSSPCEHPLSLFSDLSLQLNGWKVSVPFRKNTPSAPKEGAKASEQVRRLVAKRAYRMRRSQCVFEKQLRPYGHSFTILCRRMERYRKTTTKVRVSYSSSGRIEERVRMSLQHTLFPSLPVSHSGCPHCSRHSTDASPLIVLLPPLSRSVTSQHTQHDNKMTTAAAGSRSVWLKMLLRQLRLLIVSHAEVSLALTCLFSNSRTH